MGDSDESYEIAGVISFLALCIYLIKALFGILYWIQDNFVTYYPDISEKYGLGKAYNPPDSFEDWIWFSAITQTTVGYDRLSDGGKRRAFNKIPNRFFKIINFTQICSILILASFMFNN